jgi:HSP20 family protein
MAEAKPLRRREYEGETERVAERPTRTPFVDVFENEDEYLLQADMPGVSKDALTIRIDADELVIDGKRGDGEAKVEGRALEVETRPADYHRKFTLPEGVDADAISAELAAGVLTLRLPKSAGVKPRRIEVKAAT